MGSTRTQTPSKKSVYPLLNDHGSGSGVSANGKWEMPFHNSSQNDAVFPKLWQTRHRQRFTGDTGQILLFLTTAKRRNTVRPSRTPSGEEQHGPVEVDPLPSGSQCGHLPHCSPPCSSRGQLRERYSKDPSRDGQPWDKGYWLPMTAEHWLVTLPKTYGKEPLGLLMAWTGEVGEVSVDTFLGLGFIHLGRSRCQYRYGEDLGKTGLGRKTVSFDSTLNLRCFLNEQLGMSC